METLERGKEMKQGTYRVKDVQFIFRYAEGDHRAPLYILRKEKKVIVSNGAFMFILEAALIPERYRNYIDCKGTKVWQGKKEIATTVRVKEAFTAYLSDNSTLELQVTDRLHQFYQERSSYLTRILTSPDGKEVHVQEMYLQAIVTLFGRDIQFKTEGEAKPIAVYNKDKKYLGCLMPVRK